MAAFRFCDDGCMTATSLAQSETENIVSLLFGRAEAVSEPAKLARQQHLSYLYRNIRRLPSGYTGADSTRPWLVYWTVQSMSLLDEVMEVNLARACVDFLYTCQHETGGFGGGPLQRAHLATTYSSIASLSILANHPELKHRDVFAPLNRDALRQYLMRCKHDSGRFKVSADGESDTRGAYCALASAALAGLFHVTEEERKSGAQVECALWHNTAQWIARCQTYEGGFGGEPNNEAHGGYSYCALSALSIIEQFRRYRSAELQVTYAPTQLDLDFKQLTVGSFWGRCVGYFGFTLSHSLCFPVLVVSKADALRGWLPRSHWKTR